jgi:hypothetical protein
MDTKGITQKLMVDLTLYIMGKYNKDLLDLIKRLRDVTKNDFIELPEQVITE